MLIKLTRLYTKKGQKQVNKQTFLLAPAAVESVRPSSVLSGQKATVRTLSGMELSVAETKDAVVKLLQNAMR